MLLGSPLSSVALVDNAATIGTPVLHRVYGSVGSLATSGYGMGPGIQVNLDGSIFVQPGYAILSYASAALTSALIMHFMWEEIAAV